MVGSTMSVSGPNIVLNTIVADVLSNIADELEKAEDFKATLSEIIEKLVRENFNVIFDGDGYDPSWIDEAEKRGLPNIKTSVEAIEIFSKPEYVKLFERHGVFTEGEVLARQEIMFEEYAKTINIEALAMIQIAKREILPATLEYACSVADSVASIKSVVSNADISAQSAVVEKVNALYGKASKALADLESTLTKVQGIDEIGQQAKAYKFEVFEAMQALREPCDALEEIVSEDFWPFPTYGDLLFRV
jgi:glutamine synthetase